MQQAPTQESSGAATQEEELMRALGQLTAQSGTTTTALQPDSLPNLWLHKLATHVNGLLRRDKASRTALMAVFRTCTACRDAILLSRRALLSVQPPIHRDKWPGVLEHACAVLSRSRKVWLVVQGPGAESDWTETEPSIIHLLLCVRSKLGATALEGIKAVRLVDLQHSALVPAWFRELCPSATHLHLHRTGPPTTPASRPAPAPHHSLRELTWVPRSSLDIAADPITRHVRQQLAALPALASLTAPDLDWAGRPAVISSTLTRLELYNGLSEQRFFRHHELFWTPMPIHLPAQFPSLREFDSLRSYVIVDDAGLRALLSLPNLRALKVPALRLSTSHRAGPWPHHLDLHVKGTSVDTLALLPLDRIPHCAMTDHAIEPSRDAARAERVAAALRRWGTFLRDGSAALSFTCSDFAAALASLPPFLKAALPQTSGVLDIVLAEDLPPARVRRLAALLTPNVRTLRFTNSSFTPGVWPGLLPSLPPSVAELELAVQGGTFNVLSAGQLPSMEQLLSMCLGAVRPVKVRVVGPGAEALVQCVCAKMERTAKGCLVRLEGDEGGGFKLW